MSPLLVLVAISIFVAAYGNAMRKKVYRRRSMVAEGRDVPEMSTLYDRTSLALFLAGMLGIAAFLVLYVWGNQISTLIGQ